MKSIGRLLGIDLLSLSVLVFIAVLLHRGIEAHHDIQFWDEAYYLVGGVMLSAHHLPSAAYAPLYAVWYWLLSVCQHDRVALFHLNHSLLMGILALGCYAVIRLLRGRPLSAFVLAFYVLTSAAMESYPYVTHLAIVIILLGMIAAAAARSWPVRCVAISWALAAASFVRPELSVAFLVWMGLMGGMGTWAVCTRRASRRMTLTVAVLSTLPAAGLISLFGNPLSGGRSSFAFAQHYAINYVLKRQLAINPCTCYADVLQEDFGCPTPTIGEAFRANPGALCAHVWENVRNTPVRLAPLLQPLTGSLAWERKLKVWSLAWLLMPALGFAVWKARRIDAARDQGLIAVLLIAGCAVVPSLIAICLIWPRDHYLLVVFVPGICVLGGLAAVGRPAGPPPARIRAFLGPAGAWGIALALTIGTIQRQAKKPNPPLAGTRSVQILKQLKLQRPLVILEASVSRAFFTDYAFTSIAMLEKNQPFLQFIKERGVNVIFMEPALMVERNFCSDDEFRRFLASPSDYGFRVIDVPGTPGRFLIASSLLEASTADARR